MPDKVSIHITCARCKTIHTIRVYYKDINKYALNTPGSEGLIQNVFSYLSANDRELLISHICPICWDKIFK